MSASARWVSERNFVHPDDCVFATQISADKAGNEPGDLAIAFDENLRAALIDLYDPISALGA